MDLGGGWLWSCNYLIDLKKKNKNELRQKQKKMERKMRGTDLQ